MTTTTPTLRRLQHHQHDDIYRHSHDVNQRQRRHSDANYSVRPVGIQRATIQRYAGWEFSGSNFVASTCKQLLTTPPRLLLAPTTTFRLLPTFSMGRSCRKRQGQEDRGLSPPGTRSSRITALDCNNGVPSAAAKKKQKTNNKKNNTYISFRVNCGESCVASNNF